MKRALVLTGGYGTRLRPLTHYTPKCLLPVAGKPLALYMIENLVKAGVTDIAISGFRDFINVFRGIVESEKIKANFTYIVEDTFSDASKPGAIGAMEIAFRKLPEDDYIIVGADNFSPDFDFKSLIKAHEKGKAPVTIALHRLQDQEKLPQFGIAVVDEKGEVKRFQEKPDTPEEAFSNLVNTAMYAADRDFVKKTIPEYCQYKKKRKEKPDNLGEIFEVMLTMGKKVQGFVFEEHWTDVGKAWGYMEANHYQIEKLTKGGKMIAKSARIDKGAFIEPPCFIGEGCIIREGSVIGPNSYLSKNANIGRNCVVRGAVLGEGVTIGPEGNITNCTIDDHAHLGIDVTVEKNALIGRNAKIGNNSWISAYTRLH
jgi:mannose-1-phosphate guanylyltransferase/phosphomannomutase